MIIDLFRKFEQNETGVLVTLRFRSLQDEPYLYRPWELAVLSDQPRVIYLSFAYRSSSDYSKSLGNWFGSIPQIGVSLKPGFL